MSNVSKGICNSPKMSFNPLFLFTTAMSSKLRMVGATLSFWILLNGKLYNFFIFVHHLTDCYLLRPWSMTKCEKSVNGYINNFFVQSLSSVSGLGLQRVFVSLCAVPKSWTAERFKTVAGLLEPLLSVSTCFCVSMNNLWTCLQMLFNSLLSRKLTMSGWKFLLRQEG